jgi:hypothetical protein
MSALLLSVFLAGPLPARTHGHPGRQPDWTDPRYVSALATANRFLNAWQTADLESGTLLLSDTVRHSQSAERVEQFFSKSSSSASAAANSSAANSASSNDRAFEIAHGRGHAGRFTFPVVFVTPGKRHVTRRFSEVVIIDTGKNDWVVDKLP